MKDKLVFGGRGEMIKFIPINDKLVGVSNRNKVIKTLKRNQLEILRDWLTGVLEEKK